MSVTPEEAYEMGCAEKQAEIDELRAEIEKLEKKLAHSGECGACMDGEDAD